MLLDMEGSFLGMMNFINNDDIEENRDMCLLSCYVVTYNRAKYLKYMIDSILCQSYYDFKLYILDNASTDNTEEIVRSYTDERVRYIRHNNNIGGLENIRYAFEICETEYLIVLHDDDIVNPTLFEREIEVLQNKKEITLVSSNSILIDEEGKQLNICKVIDNDTEYYKNRYLSEYLYYGNTLVFPTIMYRNSFIKDNNISLDVEVGPCADVIFCADIIRTGGIAYELAEPLILYRIHSGQDSYINRIDMQVQLLDYIYSSSRFEKQLEEIRIHSADIWKNRVKGWILLIITQKYSKAEAILLMEKMSLILKMNEREVRHTKYVFIIAYRMRKYLYLLYKIYYKIKGKL